MRGDVSSGKDVREEGGYLQAFPDSWVKGIRDEEVAATADAQLAWLSSMSLSPGCYDKRNRETWIKSPACSDSSLSLCLDIA